MKKLIALVLTLMFTLTAVAALAEAPATTDTPSRTLVVYYSATGSTERIANMIAEETGADVFGLRCRPAPPSPRGRTGRFPDSTRRSPHPACARCRSADARDAPRSGRRCRFPSA